MVGVVFVVGVCGLYVILVCLAKAETRYKRWRKNVKRKRTLKRKNRWKRIKGWFAARFDRIAYLVMLFRVFPWFAHKVYPPAELPEVEVPEGVEFEERVDDNGKPIFEEKLWLYKRMWRKRFPELIPEKERLYWAKVNMDRGKKRYTTYDDPFPGEYEGLYWHAERLVMSYVFVIQCRMRDRRRRKMMIP